MPDASATEDIDDLSTLLELKWRRCQREARGLMFLELAQTALAVGVLVIVALCGIVAITHSAVSSGAVALPLGLGLAVSVALTLLGLAYRTRMALERVTQDLYKVECALRSAAELRKGDGHPYRVPAAPASPASPAEAMCMNCLFEVHARRFSSDAR